MTFDLTEARRLHDRADHDPSSCRTCPDTWPCATAIALGATGRSEWTNAPDTTNDPSRLCCYEWIHAEQHTLMCNRPKGHPGKHENTVSPEDNTQCPSIAPGGLPCMGDAGHESRHWNTQTANRWLDPGQIPCDGENPGGWRCDLTTGHTGNHYGRNGDTW